jgi:hypothetical protein
MDIIVAADVFYGGENISCPQRFTSMVLAVDSRVKISAEDPIGGSPCGFVESKIRAFPETWWMGMAAKSTFC